MSQPAKHEKAVFLAALEKHTLRERLAFLENACTGDPHLMERVKELLATHQESRGPLDLPPPGVDATIDQPITEKPGTVIDRYKLLEQIGEGGFGVVFMAEQEEPVRRKVALKIIKPGMDTKEVIARFEAERQALAIMDHPNIAKVLDAGATESGRPYFVMELVRGISITDFCDQNSLPTRERLELFASVCQAVQHAHQKGIIHRDIKPSNVMVTLRDDTPVAKVIDFGVAKATNARLTEKTLFTRFGQMIGTPLYMSPEQAGMSALDVDTRSDIYSLGVLLYELLTGATPFDQQRIREAAYDELLKIIREEEPPKPSQRISSLGETLPSVAAQRKLQPKKLSALVRGELDWIVMKALEKDRARRYETATSFAADVQRYLDDEPVQACPPSAAYRFKKFARRNRPALTMATIVGLALLLVVGVVAGSIGWVARDHSARRLVVERTVERALADSDTYLQQGDYQRSLAEARRAETALATGEVGRQWRRRIARRIEDLEMVARLEEIRLEASTYHKGFFDYAGSDRKYAQAFQDFGIDLESLDSESAAEGIRARAVAVELAVALDQWAYARRWVVPREDTTWQPLVAAAKAADPHPVRNRLRSLWGQQVTEENQEELAQLAAAERLQPLSPTTLCLLATALRRGGLSQEAIQVLRRARQLHPADFWVNMDLGGRLREEAPKEGEAVSFFLVAVALRPRSPAAHHGLALALQYAGRRDEAIACYREVIEIDPRYATAHNNLSVVLSEKVYLDREKGYLDELFVCHEKAIEIDPENAIFHHNFGIALQQEERLDEAITCFEKAIELQPDFPFSHIELGQAFRALGKLDQAVSCLETAIAIRRDSPELHDIVGSLLHHSLGSLLLEQGNLDDAITHFRKASERNSNNAAAHLDLGLALARQAELDQALSPSDEAIECFRRVISIDPAHVLAYKLLGHALRSKGDLDGAIDAYSKRVELIPESAPAHHSLGVALRDKGDLEGAIGEFQQAVEYFSGVCQQTPDDEGARKNLGIALRNLAGLLRRQGRYVEATAHLTRDAISLSQNSYQLWSELAHCHLALSNAKEYDEACRSMLEQFPEPDQRSIADWGHLGQALYRAGRFDEARESLEKVIELRGDEGPSLKGGPRWWYYTMILFQSGETDQARAYFEELVEVMKEDPPTNKQPHERLRAEVAGLLGIDVELEEKEEP